MPEYLVIHFDSESGEIPISQISADLRALQTMARRLGSVSWAREVSADNPAVQLALRNQIDGFFPYDPKNTDDLQRPIFQVVEAWRRFRRFETYHALAQACKLPESTVFRVFHRDSSPQKKTLEGFALGYNTDYLVLFDRQLPPGFQS